MIEIKDWMNKREQELLNWQHLSNNNNNNKSNNNCYKD
jgi:hypothetical protein